ncbi:MAG: S8 family serine peptidase [Phycisphaerae bacterium]
MMNLRCNSLVAVSLLGVAVIAFPATRAMAQHSPLEWYGPAPLDDTDGDKIEDLITQTIAPNESIDVVVCFINDCTPTDRLADLACLGAVGYCSTVVASAQLLNVTLADLAVIAGWPEVGYIHLDHVMEKHMTTAGQALGAHAGFYSPNTAEDQGFDGTGVTIAVLDTGCDDPGGPGVTHAHLPAAIGGVYVLDNNAGLMVGNPDDIDGHGTSVAGCALGRGDNGGDNRGMAPGAQLFDCRITPPTPPNGNTGSTSGSNIQRVVDWLVWNHNSVDPPIRAANLSFGSSIASSGTSLTASIEALVGEGVVVCVSAGNHDDCPFTGLGHIAVASRAITVAAATYLSTIDRADDIIAQYSAKGPGLGLSPKPDITAYGNNCTFTCVPKPQCVAAGVPITAPTWDTATDYRDFGGTSAASPMVAGAAALIIERNPAIHPIAVKKLLMDTAEPRGPADRWGAGLMDLSAIFVDQAPFIECDLRVKSISFAPKPMVPNDPVTITIEVENVGAIAVEDFCVEFERWYFGPNAFPHRRYPIGGEPERNMAGPLNPGLTRSFQRDWTPGVTDKLPFDGKSCFWGRVIAACDTHSFNNQKNVNTYIDTLTLGGGRGGPGGPADVSEVEFRLGHDQQGLINTQITLANPDPSNWLAELDFDGVIGQTLIIPVDNQTCPVSGILRTTRLNATAPPVNITVQTSDPLGMPLGDMTVTVTSGSTTEACCFGDDQCSMLPRSDCVSAGGSPQGPDTDCNPSNAACAPERCSDPGDMNGDGVFDGDDVPGFVNCLIATGATCICADVDRSGLVDGGDAAALVDRLLNAPSCL